MERRYGDKGTSNKCEEVKRNGDCDTGSVKGSGKWSVCGEEEIHK